MSADESVNPSSEMGQNSKDNSEEVRLTRLLNLYREWIGATTHELRGPLSSAAMALNTVMQRSDLPDAVTSSLRTAERSVAEMSDLVQDMFDIIKLELGAFELSLTPNVSVYEIFEGITEEFASQKEVLSFRSVPDRSIVATLDEDRIRQVIRNLVSNAVKYTQRGKQATIAISMRRFDNHYFEIAVDDAPNGLGMSSTDLYSLNSHEPFWRSPSAKEIATGTGLGVQLSRSLVERSGGSLTYESEFGKGTKATIKLPYISEPSVK